MLSLFVPLTLWAMGHVQLEMNVSDASLFGDPQSYEAMQSSQQSVPVSQAVAAGAAWACQSAEALGIQSYAECLRGYRVEAALAVVAEALWGDATSGNGPANILVAPQAAARCAQARLEQLQARCSDGFWREVSAAEDELHYCALPTLMPGAPSVDEMFAQLEAAARDDRGEFVVQTPRHAVTLRTKATPAPAP